MIKVKITFAEVQCEITKELQSGKLEVEQVVEAFELALKGCGFDLGDKQFSPYKSAPYKSAPYLEFKNND